MASPPLRGRPKRTACEMHFPGYGDRTSPTERGAARRSGAPPPPVVAPSPAAADAPAPRRAAPRRGARARGPGRPGGRRGAPHRGGARAESRRSRARSSGADRAAPPATEAPTFRAALHHTLEDPARTLALYEELAACYRDLGQPSEAGYYLRRALRLAPHRDDLRQLHDQTISISERFEAVTQREIWLPPVEQEDLPTQGSDDPAWPQANP